MVRLPFRLINRKFSADPKAYFIQPLIAVAAVVVLLSFVTLLTHAVIVAVLGASSFIVFVMPRAPVAETRRLIGGHVIGVVIGLACYYLFLTGPIGRIAQQESWVKMVAAGVSIGLAVLLMPLFDAEHPPAAGTALGLIVVPWTYGTIIFILAFAVSLAVVRKVLLRHLKDLV